MKRKSAIGALLVGVVALGAAMYAFAAPRAGAARTSTMATTPPVLTMNVAVTGQKQGAFFKPSIPVLAVSHEIISPRDPVSGLPTGKRQHTPIQLTMQYGPSTPKFIQALVTNENLTSVLIGLLRNGTLVATIKLTNASVSHYVQTNQNAEFDMTYQKITWTWLAGGITTSDDWVSPVT
jgi:type VI secretion system secreted protein Hcp